MRYLFQLVFGFFVFSCFCQQEPLTNLNLDTVTVVEKARNGAVALDEQSFSLNSLPNNRNNTLTELFASNGMFVKQYGLGMLATLSLNGGSANQSAMIWNGIPISSPMNGVTDVSLYTAYIFDAITIQNGASSDSWGSGAVAGTVQLENHLSQRNTQKMAVVMGSFDLYNLQVESHNSWNKWKNSSRVLWNTAKNDFSYQSGNETKHQEHNKADQFAFMQSLSRVLGPKSEIEFHYWYNNSFREIPPLTTQTLSVAEQEDVWNRIMVGFNRKGNRVLMKTKLAYFAEENLYRNSFDGIDNNNQFRQLAMDYEVHYNWGLFQLMSFANAQQVWAKSKNYAKEEQRDILAIGGRINRQIKHLHLGLQLREGLQDGSWEPLTGSFGMERKFAKHHSIKTRITKSYRQPTMNDLYWQPGGNTAVRPEETMGVEVNGSGQFSKFEYQIHSYYRKTEDWIFWIREEDELFHSPQNSNEVVSQGVNLDVKSNIRLWNVNIINRCNYRFSKSEHQQYQIAPNINKGEQVYYVPIHQGGISSTLQWKQFTVQYGHQFIGETTGFIETIDPYFLGQASIGMKQNWNKIQLQIQVTANNIWNTDYRVVERRPLPGRNYTLMIIAKHKNKT